MRCFAPLPLSLLLLPLLALTGCPSKTQPSGESAPKSPAASQPSAKTEVAEPSVKTEAAKPNELAKLPQVTYYAFKG